MPRHPAAFINALSEDGTKAEAIQWLQTTWDELQDALALLKADQLSLAEIEKNIARSLAHRLRAVDGVVVPRETLEQDDDVLAVNTRTDGHREWVNRGGWLWPGDRIVVLRRGR